jgi:uncharacterized protein YcbX
MELGSIEQLWRYPAKSMMGERLDAVEIHPVSGIPGDRAWAVRDEVRGGIRGAKKIGGLMGLAARFLDQPTVGAPSAPIEITLPDGSTVRSGDDDIAERLSAALDHEVTLWPLRPADDLDHYARGRGDSDDLHEELRSIFGRDPDEPLPDLSLLPPDLIFYESPPGTYFDAYPLLLVTDVSLASLATRSPDSVVDVRRFRPNVVIALDPDGHGGTVEGDAPEPWPEQAWVGDSIRVGEIELDIVAPCPRCVMITRDFADLPQDRGLMRVVVREANQNLGVYAMPRGSGAVRVGDAVTR